jgi:putative DNA primase/helicase
MKSFAMAHGLNAAAADPTCPPPLINADSLASCLITANALTTTEIPKRKRLLDKWLCEADLGFVFAPRGVGKTWLAMALPRAISQASSLGLWVAGEHKARVLYVDGEMPLELTQYRSRGLGLGEGDITYLHHEPVFDALGSSLNIGNEAHRSALTNLLLAQGFDCLILDNLSSLASGVEENRGDHYEPIANWLLELRRRRITVIIIHHAGRQGDVMRGHTKREDACSWIIQLRDSKQENEPGAKFVTHFAKPSRNTGDSMRDLLWHFTTNEEGRVQILCELSELSEYETFIQHVMDGIEIQAEIAEMMTKPKGTVSKWATKAVKEGRIRKHGHRLSPPAQAAKSPHDTDQD